MALRKSKPNRRHLKSSRARKRRLAATAEKALDFQTLEDRRLLAVITVTNSLADNLFPGDGVSLREAIFAANNNTSIDGSTAGDVGPDTIRFDASLAGTIRSCSTQNWKLPNR